MTTPTKPRSGMRVSVAEFLELGLPEPDDKLKMELDDGKLFIMPRPRHQSTQGAVFCHFESYFRSFDERPGRAYTDVNVALPSGLPRLFAPDLTIILRNSGAVVGDRMVEGVPDIVIEILSSDRNRDLVRKRQVYAEAGIAEYWIFDDSDNTVTPLELRDGVHVDRCVLTAGDTLTTPLLPGLEIPLGEVFMPHDHPRPADE